MTALLAARALLARVPGIAWVILLGVLLAAGGLWGAYARGQRAGVATVHRAALVDSARTVHAAVATATAVTTGRVAMATTWRAKSSAARATYQQQRDAIGAGLDSAPLPVIALVRTADTVIAHQDTTIHVQASALAAFALERDARVAADSVEAHQIALPSPPRGPDVVKTAAIVTAAVALLALVFR